jgi:reactive chlorine resistance protein C
VTDESDRTTRGAAANHPLDPNTFYEMKDKTITDSQRTSALAEKATRINFESRALRYRLVLVIGWIGLMKFTGYEANGIQPLVAHSPLMRWIYHFLTVRQFSDGLGVVEVAIAILIALPSWSPKASALGSALAILMFLTTLSFIFSTPGWERVSVVFLRFRRCLGSFC